MRKVRIAGSVIVLASLLISCLAVSTVEARTQARTQSRTVPSFRTDVELRRFLTDETGGLRVPPPPPHPPVPPPPPPSPGAQPATPQTPSITNNQLAGVDEGGIVKTTGEHLVILRRGRLFSLSVADGGLSAVDQIDAFPPGMDPGLSWYDEILVVGDRIIVIGFSQMRGATEVNRFHLSPDGRFTFLDSHHLRAGDYFSFTNSSSRLIGTQLIVYSPLRFSYAFDDPLEALPGVSRWTEGQAEPQFRRIARSRDVHAPEPLRQAGAENISLMHVVYRCDLAAAEFDCSARVVLGETWPVTFVSHNAVYLWTDTAPDVGDFGFLYRFPHDGGPVSAVQVWEGPLDHLSFHANAGAGRLDLLMASRGELRQWGQNQTGVALLRLPMSRFGDGSQPPVLSDYRFLPGLGRYGAFLTANRFIGDWVFYSTTPGSNEYGVPPGAAPAQFVAAPLDDGEPVVFDLADGVARIEPLGRDALTVGGREDVVFTTFDLSAAAPVLGPRHVQARATQTESRSHAFFFRPDPGGEGDDGVMGLPVLSQLPPEEATGAWRPHAALLFLRRQSRQLLALGRLDADTTGPFADACRVSCIDWYGNARPIFMGERVFGLMGYEIVEGRVTPDGLEEVRRVDFTPGPR